MTRLQAAPFAKDLQTLCGLGAVGGLEDGELLRRFLAGAGADRELAFAALIDRHGSMVLRVCLGVLKDRHDAEGAAQASFLILARRAPSIRRPDSLGPWLHGVALRTASRVRAGSARRREVELKAAEEVAMREHTVDQFADEESLHEEIDRLPERYKAAIVACDLEGLIHAQAAERLRVPLRTLETRLYRGRDRLRTMLIRRGVGLAALSASWTETTARAAVSVLEGAGPVASGLVAARVLAWSRLAFSERLASLVLTGSLMLASSGLLLGGASALASRGQDGRDPSRAVARVVQTPKPKPAPPVPKPSDVLRSAAQAAAEIDKANAYSRAIALARIARLQALAGDREGAASTFEQAERAATSPMPKQVPPRDAGLETRACCDVAELELQAGMPERARSLLRRIELKLPDASTQVTDGYNGPRKLDHRLSYSGGP